MKEIWKDIIGFEGIYEVSNIGRVRSLDRQIYNKSSSQATIGFYRFYPGKILRNVLQSTGYNNVTLHKEGTSYPSLVHRLVASCFIPNPENKPQVNHINSVRNDNRVENLEWCTASENLFHAYEIGTCKESKGENHKDSIISDATAIEIFKLNQKGLLNTEIAKIFGIRANLVAAVLTGRSRVHMKGIDLTNVKSNRRKFTDEQAEEIRNKHNNGASINELAKSYGVQWPIINNILYKGYYKPRKELLYFTVNPRGVLKSKSER